ncbi:MAG TPA: hypothetical protein PKE63_02595 [Lacibacter sp.]|nr:hypothetical protein [Lacibacter sp.]HMO89586.1 hypothetical protein [Lacibacter sp.]HMP86135.1 hypothetical protein [Lacibacter sp.]
MKQIRFPVMTVTLLAFLYQLTPWVGFSEGAIFGLFALSPVAVIWMVYRVLKYGTPSSYTWDEKFYEDHAYTRQGSEEKVPG